MSRTLGGWPKKKLKRLCRTGTGRPFVICSRKGSSDRNEYSSGDCSNYLVYSICRLKESLSLLRTQICGLRELLGVQSLGLGHSHSYTNPSSAYEAFII